MKLGLVALGVDQLLGFVTLVNELALRQPGTFEEFGPQLILTLISALLAMHIWQGSNLAKRAYLSISVVCLALTWAFSATAPLTNGLSPVLEGLGYVLTVAVFIGLLHPLSSRWFKEVSALRDKGSPAGTQDHAKRLQKMGLAWFLIPFVGFNVSAVVGAVPGFAAMAMVVFGAPAALVGVIIFILATVKLYRLKAQGDEGSIK